MMAPQAALTQMCKSEFTAASNQSLWHGNKLKATFTCAASDRWWVGNQG